MTATVYFEGDFLGSWTSANEVESNDFPLRVRQFWGHVELASGLSFLAGQTWTLLTTHQRGLQPLEEYLTLALSALHVVGFNWARQTGFRVTKDFGKGVWAAAALENPETHTGGVVLPGGAIRPAGSVRPIRAVQAITEFDWKPTEALQVYKYVGLEFCGRTSFSGSTVGYGSPLLDLTP